MKKTTLKDMDKAFIDVYKATDKMLDVFKRLDPKDYPKVTFIAYYFNPENPDTYKMMHIGTLYDVLAKGGIVHMQEELYMPKPQD